MLDRLFGLGARGTTVRRELLGGATTFATMTGSFARIDFDDLTELVPAFVTIAFLCLSYVFGLPH